MSSSPDARPPVHAGHEIQYRFVRDALDPAFHGFVRTYQHAFGDHPYYECTPTDTVHDVWAAHVQHCLIVAECRTCDNVVIGLACGHSLEGDVHPEIRAFLQQFDGTEMALPFDCRQALYMSEVAVLASARRLGIGTALIQLRRAWAHRNGIPYYVMRTAQRDSNSARLYLSYPIGASQAAFVQQVAGVPGEIESASTHRIWLFGATHHTDPLPEHVAW